MRSPSKLVLRPSPGELERKLQEEISKRRKERIAQVRSQSLLRGRDVAQDSKSVSKKELLKKWENASRDRINQKLMKLEVLEAQQDHFYSNHGSGRENALKELELTNIKASKACSDRRIASQRGAQALEEEINQQKVNNLFSKKQSDMKKTALLNEKIRSRRILKKNTNFVEFNAPKGAVISKSVPLSEIVSTGKENVVVIRNAIVRSEDGYAQACSEPLILPPPPKESLAIRKMKQEAAKKIQKAKEDFMNISDLVRPASMSDEGSSLNINAKIIREEPPIKDSPDGNVTQERIREEEVPTRMPPEKKVPRESKRRPFCSPVHSSTDSLHESSSTMERSEPSITSEKGGLRVLVNVAEASSSTMDDDSSRDLTSSEHQDSSRSLSSEMPSDPVVDKLKEYIEKCMNMRREELDELSSVATTSYLESSSSMNATPPPSILSSNSKKKPIQRRSGKSVRFSSSTSAEESDGQKRPEILPPKEHAVTSKPLPSISSLSLDLLSEGILTPTSSEDSPFKDISPLSSSKIDSLKDKIFNMEMPILQRRAEKLESSSTFISSSIFFSTDLDEKVSKIESLDSNALVSSSDNSGFNNNYNSC